MGSINNFLLVGLLICGEELKLPSRLILHTGNMADMITTINRGPDAYEANPLIGKDPSDLFIISTKVLGGLTLDYLLTKLSKDHPKYANILAITIGITFASVAYHNYQVRHGR